MDDLIFISHLRGAPLLRKFSQSTSSSSSSLGYFCFICKERGHFANNCPSKSSSPGVGPFRNVNRGRPAVTILLELQSIWVVPD